MVLRSGGCPRIDERLGYSHRCCVSQRRIELIERIRAGAYGAPRNLRAVSFQQGQRAKEVSWFTSPAPADVQVFAVDRLMHVDRARSGVRVVASDDVSAAITRQAGAFLERTRRSRGLDDNVNAFTMCES